MTEEEEDLQPVTSSKNMPVVEIPSPNEIQDQPRESKNGNFPSRSRRSVWFGNSFGPLGKYGKLKKAQFSIGASSLEVRTSVSFAFISAANKLQVSFFFVVCYRVLLSIFLRFLTLDNMAMSAYKSLWVDYDFFGSTFFSDSCILSLIILSTEILLFLLAMYCI